MRTLLTITILLFVYSCSGPAAEPAETVQVVPTAPAVEKTDIKEAVYAYNNAMIAKDTATLNSLLHDDLSYGHSNGWIETKAEQKENLFNGTIAYNKVDQPELQVIEAGDIATVRGNAVFDVDYKGTEHMLFGLHVMQTWIWQDGRWQMLNRQSIANKK